jgi:succinate dehydrogenase flavin-adding protein (antitoxin of CptAB toxin-antitoxin module)
MLTSRHLQRPLWRIIATSHTFAMSTRPTLDTLRARLTYRSRKRGILETDLLLSTFAKVHLPSMSEAELLEYGQVRR